MAEFHIGQEIIVRDKIYSRWRGAKIVDVPAAGETYYLLEHQDGTRGESDAVNIRALRKRATRRAA